MAGTADALTLIRKMTVDDVPAGLALSRAARWNQTERDWRHFLTAAPDGALVAEQNGAVIGTVATLPYGAFAWISMVLVDPAARGKGIGTTLLHRGLELVPEGVTPRLDATPAGEELYRKLGFAGEYGLERWFLDSGRARALPEPAARPLEPSDWQAIGEMDLRAFGAPRVGLLQRLAAEAPDHPVLDGDRGSRPVGRLDMCASMSGQSSPAIRTPHACFWSPVSPPFLNARFSWMCLTISRRSGCFCWPQGSSSNGRSCECTAANWLREGSRRWSGATGRLKRFARRQDRREGDKRKTIQFSPFSLLHAPVARDHECSVTVNVAGLRSRQVSRAQTSHNDCLIVVFVRVMRMKLRARPSVSCRAQRTGHRRPAFQARAQTVIHSHRSRSVACQILARPLSRGSPHRAAHDRRSGSTSDYGRARRPGPDPGGMIVMPRMQVSNVTLLPAVRAFS
jgi:GNAT superfamily N-acetyltransferase